MGVTSSNDFTDGLTPICDCCGIVLCWDISIYDYLDDVEFWDNWKCKDCDPEYRKRKNV